MATLFMRTDSDQESDRFLPGRQETLGTSSATLFSPQHESSQMPSPAQSTLLAVPPQHQDSSHSNTTTLFSRFSTEEPPSHTRPAYKVSRAEEWWVLEIFCTLLSLGAVVAIFVILKLHDGKTSSTWTFYFSINAIVSTLGTLAKSSLALGVSACLAQSKWIWFKKRQNRLRDFELLDNASRGPLGSIELLWRKKGRHLASIGTVVTIVALAVDPSLQSLISYSIRRVPQVGGASALVAQAQRFDAGLEWTYGVSVVRDDNNNSWVPAHTSADFGIRAGLYIGLLNSTSPSQLAPFVSCATGNCTWPIFASLAICSSCFDLSDYLSTTSIPAGEFTNDVVLGKGNGNMAVYTTNGTQISLLPYNFLHINNDNGLGGGYGEYMTASITSDPKESFHFIDMETLLLSVSMLRAADSYVNNITRWEDTPITALKCGLYMCINAYNTTVTQGNISENIVGTWSSKVPMSWQMYGNQVQATDIQNMSAVQTLNWNPIYNKIHVDCTDMQLTIPAGDGHVDLPPNVNFNASQAALDSTVDFLSSLLDNGTGSMTYRGPSRDIMQPLYASTNLTTTFQNLADSLSVAMRNSAPLSTAPRGITFQDVRYFHIRWGWFVVPLVTTLAGCTFVAASIQQTRRQGVAAWKSSSLATLVHGLDEKTRAEVRRASAMGNAKGVGYVRVGMRDAPDGVELQGA